MNNRRRRILRLIKKEHPFLYQIYLVAKAAKESGLTVEETKMALAILYDTRPVPIKWHKQNKGWR